jgi:hypothetical protein
LNISDPYLKRDLMKPLVNVAAIKPPRCAPGACE